MMPLAANRARRDGRPTLRLGFSSPSTDFLAFLSLVPMARPSCAAIFLTITVMVSLGAREVSGASESEDASSSGEEKPPASPPPTASLSRATRSALRPFRSRPRFFSSSFNFTTVSLLRSSGRPESSFDAAAFAVGFFAPFSGFFVSPPRTILTDF